MPVLARKHPHAPHLGALRIAMLGALTLAPLAPRARAEEVPETFTPVRPAGMGGAFTAVANDESSVWTNPAGISRSRKARSRDTFNLGKFPNLIVGANSNSRDFYQAMKGGQEDTVEGIVTNLDVKDDEPFWVRAALFPIAILTPSRETPMAVGFYSNTTAKALITKEDPEEARVSAISDLGGVLNFTLTNASNRFGVGLQIRPVARYAYEDRVPSEQLLDKDAMKERAREGANKSQGLGADVGMMYTIADFWFPTIGVAVLNLPTGCRDHYLNPFTEKPERVCGTLYSGDFGNEDALSTVDPTDIRVGIAITPRLSRSLGMRFALDAHQIPVGSADQSYGLQGVEVSKLVHAGVELFVGNPLKISPFSLRAGYSQGFASVGATVNLGILELEFATYGRDVSSTEKPIEDRRILASLGMDF
jgi:hypothetical protein